MEDGHRESAERMRERILAAEVTPAVFRAALTAVPPSDRDAWLDWLFGLDTVPEDGPHLPRGCVPYMPCSVDALLRIVDHAEVRDSDVFVDLGSGVGRAAAVMHLLTGAATIGLEIQPELVRAARDLTSRLNVMRFSVIEGDAARLCGHITIGSVFFLYCPFSGDRLEQVLRDLEPIARTRPIRVCCVDLPLPPRPWLTLAAAPSGDVAIYRSTLLDPAPSRP